MSGVRSEIRRETRGAVAIVTLADPKRRNALGRGLFDALERAVAETVGAYDPSGVRILRLRGEGPAFCSGFDLSECMGDQGQETLRSFIERLSKLNRAIRRSPLIAVAEVHGAALAGGCALISACDFACTAPDAQLGYPVHRIGVSPAVTAPLLLPAIGAGPARELLLSGEIIDGSEARRRRLVTHLADDAGSLPALVEDLCESLSRKGAGALAATKNWLNELDGSDRDVAFDRAMSASTSLCGGAESLEMLDRFWKSRQS